MMQAETHLPDASELSSLPGTYVLVVNLDRHRQITIGRRSTRQFQPGYYLYVGSAFGPGGLKARVGRHMRSEKKCDGTLTICYRTLPPVRSGISHNYVWNVSGRRR